MSDPSNDRSLPVPQPRRSHCAHLDAELLGESDERCLAGDDGGRTPDQSGVFPSSPFDGHGGRPVVADDLIDDAGKLQPLRRIAGATILSAETSQGVVLALYLASRKLVEDTDAFERLVVSLTALDRCSDIEGIVRILQVGKQGRVVACDLWTAGTATHVHALLWPLPQRLTMLMEVCRAVSALHARGITLGHLSPAAIVFDDDLRPLVDTFAAASPCYSDDDAATRYFAPEVRAGATPGRAADVYSLGCILRFITSGQEPPEPPLDVSPTSAGRMLERVARHATAHPPNARYPSVEALLVDLQLAHLSLLGQPALPRGFVVAPPELPDQPPAEAEQGSLPARRARRAKARHWVASMLAVMLVEPS